MTVTTILFLFKKILDCNMKLYLQQKNIQKFKFIYDVKLKLSVVLKF